jgi:hypothetical protein
VVGLASRVFNGGKNIFSLQEGVISKNFFEGSPPSQEIQDVGNAETKTPNAGAASALSFFHRYPLQPFDAHKLEVYDGSGQSARKSQPGGREKLAQHWSPTSALSNARSSLVTFHSSLPPALATNH